MECFSIISRIEINNQSIEQCQIIHEKYVVTTTKGRTIIYLPPYDSHFIINKKEKLLQKVDLSIQIQQMEQLKNMAGEIFTTDEEETLLIAGFKTNCKSFHNIANGIKIQG